MLKRRFKLGLGVVVLLSIVHASATTMPFKTTLTNSYYYADHHEIQIDQPAKKVWPHLVNLGSWMYDFEMAHFSGPKGGVGEVLRLYQGQEYFFQVTTLLPNRLLVGINLPSTTPKGELSEGVAMFTLTERDNKTVVSVYMNRKYSWLHETKNTAREIRETEKFNQVRKKTFSRFLNRLREISEAGQ